MILEIDDVKNETEAHSADDLGSVSSHFLLHDHGPPSDLVRSPVCFGVLFEII